MTTPDDHTDTEAPHTSLEEEVNFEPEDELGDIAAAQAKLKKLKQELASVKKERQEYLDGWQRAQADLMNAKREAQTAIARARHAGIESFVADLIPALDSFDMAMQGSTWHSVDAAWRVGVESIRAQLLAVLVGHGIETYGVAGDAFDPTLHEPVSEEEGGTPHTVAKVLRPGYRTKERVIRPAQVSIYS